VQTLPTDLTSAHQKIILLSRENEYLKEQLRLTVSRLFGRSSEKRPVESPLAQILLFPKVEMSNEPAKTERIEYTRKKPQSIEGKLPEGTRFPENLPREETIIDEGEGEIAFEKITERLAAKKNPFYIKRIVRRIRKVDGRLKSPQLPPAVIEGTTVDISFLVYLLIAKYVWHLPLYRQEQILKAQGIKISRDTLIRYVIAIASLLKPIYQALGVKLFEGSHLFGDETPVLVGKEAKGKKSYTESWFWAFLGDSGCAFYHAPSRAFKEVAPLLASYSGYLQSDGYNVYEKLSREYPEITLVGCWAHARRKFTDAEKGGNAPEATEAMRYIRALYRVEARIRKKELKPPDILKLRQRFSRKVLLLFNRWLKAKASDPNLLPKSLFAVAINYSLKRWQQLCLYTTNPALAIDSNAVEREIRPIALGKKNWLFCASETGAEASAIIYSLIASCRLAKIDPFDYFIDILDRISSHPASMVIDLIPARWSNTIKTLKLAAAA
jgi:transposase